MTADNVAVVRRTRRHGRDTHLHPLGLDLQHLGRPGRARLVGKLARDHRRQDEREQDCQGERDEDRLADRDHEDGQDHRPELVEVELNRRER